MRFRKDSFMDLSLVIKPFGSKEINGSVEEAIEFFVRPETMSDGNQV
jgi:ubiquitin carboxyl-terminal hydrolase 47